MAHLTKEAWLAQLEECGGDISQDALIKLIFLDGPNALWSDVVQEMQLKYNSIYTYLTSFFPMRVWKDWQGVDELQRTYHQAYLPFDFSIFKKTMQDLACGPSLNECHTDYCSVPKGGLTQIPPLEMYKWGFKTDPECIANIRTSFAAKQIAEKIVKERFNIDEQVMNMFYTMAVIRMLGHKWVLEYEQNGTDITPVANANPYNILGGFRYSYMNPLFPQVGNINNIMPLDLRFLDMFGRALVNSQNPNFVARGPRNTPIFELWCADDIYKQECLDNPEYIERMRYIMKTELLPGYTLDPGGEKEVIGNFNFRTVAALPRFAESTQGGLTVVQTHSNIAVDGGNRAYHNFREWDNAPILMSLALGKGIGEILTRPALTTSISGKPIMPITGTGDWTYRNDYDKECNEDMNMPHFRKRYEMGFRMLTPDAGWGFLGRAKKFRLRPVNTCDLQPLFAVEPSAITCDVVTIGCDKNIGQTTVNNILEQSGARHVACSAVMCGSPTMFRLVIPRGNVDSITPNYNPLGCVCGDDVFLIITDGDGVTTRQIEAKIVEYIRPNVIQPNPQWFVELDDVDDAPDADECITGVACQDATPTVATVITCIDNETDPDLPATKIRFVVDSLLSCEIGATVTITYKDIDGATIGTKSGTIASRNDETFTYEITSTAPFECDTVGGTGGVVTITITCA